MSEQLTSLSQSIVEIAKEVDGHVTDWKKNTPKDDKAALVSARLALDRLLQQSKNFGRASIQARTGGIALTIVC